MPVRLGSAATIDATRTVHMEVQELTTVLGSWGYPGLPARLLRTTRWFERCGHVLVLIAGSCPERVRSYS